MLDNAPNLEITDHFSGLYSYRKISRAVTGLIEYTSTYKTGGVFFIFQTVSPQVDVLKCSVLH